MENYNLELDLNNKKILTNLMKCFDEEVYSFLIQKDKILKKALSNGQYRLLEQYFEKKETSIQTIHLFFNKLSEEDKLKFKSRIVKKTFNKEIADGLLNGSVSRDKLCEFMAMSKSKDLFERFWSLFGISYKDEFEQTVREIELGMNAARQQNDTDSQEKLIEELQLSIATLQKENKQLKTDSKNIRGELDKEKQKVSELEEYKTKLKDADKKLKELQAKIDNGLVKNKKVIREIDNNIENTEPEKEEYLSTQKYLESLESQYFIGVVRQDGIKLTEMNCVVVTPLIPILIDVSYIKRDEILSKVAFRNDRSTFLAFNDFHFRKVVLDDEALAIDFNNMDNADKYNIISSALVGKTIVFRPEFKQVPGDTKKKLNAIVHQVFDSSDFQNAIFIPFFGIGKKQFEEKIKSKSVLEIDNYPISMFSTLRYILVKDSIYEIDYVPNRTNDECLYQWKQNSDKINKIMDINNNENQKDFFVVYADTNKEIVVGIYIKRLAIAKINNVDTALAFNEELFLKSVLENTANNNLCYSPEDVKNFHIAIKSSKLVILAGPSGIGKTRLPLMYASALGLKNTKNSLLFLPISPSFVEPEDILGYLKPAGEVDDEGKIVSEYVESPASLVSFLMDASNNTDSIHIVMFDEMNLSQIEHWFAPFLSLMEMDSSDRKLVLYPESTSVKNGDYPPYLLINDNVFFVGTVNIDETTKSLSDRLLDRAIVINLDKRSFSDLKRIEKDETQKNYPEIKYSAFETAIKYKDNYIDEFNEDELKLIQDVNDLMLNSIMNKGVSFRTLKKISTYLANAEGILTRADAIDFAIMEMIIGRINGTREELEQILISNPDAGILGILNTYNTLSDFARCKDLINRKINEIIKYGYTN